MKDVIYYDTMTNEVLMVSHAVAPQKEESEPVAAAAASTEQSPVAERIQEPTFTPVEGSVAATEPAVTSAEDSEKAAKSTVTPVAAAEEASLPLDMSPFYVGSRSLRAPGIVRVALKGGAVVPMAITTGPEIVLQPENQEVAEGKLADSLGQAIEGGYLKGKTPGLSQVADGPISLNRRIQVADYYPYEGAN